ncbi:MAG: fluoride efflux transporter CrcB [Gemmatimonadaceae bacterium]|nr:fluoride efflux transporter CrcB [Gemmatimonadaceae bacterium]
MSTPTPPLSATVLLVVAVGGAIGSVARYGVGVVMAPATSTFPWATLVVNVLGAFLIGWFARLFAAPDADHVLRLALTTGFCGGFTTFSTLSAETVSLLQQGKAGRAAAYIVLSLALGLAATFAGLSAGTRTS